MESTPPAPAVTRNTAASRFEIAVGTQLATLDFVVDGRRMLLVHTEVPAALEGRGLGGRLVKAALEHARSHGLLVVPRCPFVGGYLERHPEYAGLVVRD